MLKMNLYLYSYQQQ